MKKFITLLIVLLAFSSIQAQSGYIGVSAGYAVPGGDAIDGLEDGIDLGFIHLGYRFTENWGMVANLNSSGHLIEGSDVMAYGIAYIGIGPMYTLPINDRMSLDIKPQAAMRLTGKPSGFGYQDGVNLDNIIFRGNGLLLGTSLVMGGQRGFAFSLNVDYLSGTWTKVEYDGEEFDWSEMGSNNPDDLTQFKVGVGVRYNF